MVRLYDIFPQGLGFVLVFEFMVTDLSEVIADADSPIMPAQAKAYMQMLLKGMAYLHRSGIMHRDLKPANLLIRYPLICSSMHKHRVGIDTIQSLMWEKAYYIS